MPWIIAKHYQITINLSPTTFFAPVILIQAIFISSMTLLLLSCSHPFSTCFTPFSTTNKLQHFFRFVTGESLHNVNCTFGNCGLSLFSNQWKLLKNKKDLPPDSMHAPCMLFPRVRLGWERLVEYLVPQSRGLATPGEDHGVIRKPAVLCYSHSYLKNQSRKVSHLQLYILLD